MSLMDDFGHLKIPLKDIKAATNNFTDKPIGAGGFGKVYKGVLHLQNGQRMVAAFKRLDRIYGQGDVEFWKEIMMLYDLKHKNLARLLYFCNEDDERILVYKYISRGSLDRYLGDSSLTWPQRLIICHGVGKAIAYLHDPKESQHRIVHRDLKSSNILLDDKWTPKVSDFGLSKICPANQPRSYLVSNIVGTPGYFDPAYFETGVLSKECDVYSFGVVLFELMCGRLCYVYDKDGTTSILVRGWKKCYDENRLDDIIFPDLKEQINEKALLIFSATARRCLNRDHKKRPTMVEIVKELEAAIHNQQNNSQHHAIVPKIPVSYQIPEEIPVEEFEFPVEEFFSETPVELEPAIHNQQNNSQHHAIRRMAYYVLPTPEDAIVRPTKVISTSKKIWDDPGEMKSEEECIWGIQLGPVKILKWTGLLAASLLAASNAAKKICPLTRVIQHLMW